MSAGRLRSRNVGGVEPEESGDFVRVPAVVDASGEKVVILIDDKGREQTRLVAELVLESFVGPRPIGGVVRFKDGDRLNCALDNLEWAPSGAPRDPSAQARAVATRARADAIRRSLEGRAHSDSGELVAEDRRR